MHTLPSKRSGFTLVEVLMVVVIIGILVGLLVPTVNFALTSVKAKAIALECQTLANAVEQYRVKHGDYPPDGSDLGVLNRHLRKAFPNIQNTEIQLLVGALTLPTGNAPVASASSGVTGAYMDASEAIPFFLGGFSADEKYPFSGVGGPIYIVDANGTQINSSQIANAASVQYNPDRNKPLYEFKQNQLTVDNSSGFAISSDDAITGGTADLLPSYVPAGKTVPFVYFDARTYLVPADSSVGRTSAQFNHYLTSSSGNVAAYRSTEINTKVSLQNPPHTYSEINSHYRAMNEKTFQLLSAGLDDHYGGTSFHLYMFKPSETNSTSTFASGDSIEVTSQGNVNAGNAGFLDSDGSKYQLDNVANFSDGKFSDSLAN